MIAEINRSSGATRVFDGNAGKTLGYFEIANNILDGKRQWSSACYKLGSNVTVQCSTQVSRLIIIDQKVQGVEVLTGIGGDKTIICVKDEVILCSGVQGSAKILLLRYVAPISSYSFIDK
jgi:choline dehydrogenase-like flavoprotein